MLMSLLIFKVLRGFLLIVERTYIFIFWHAVRLKSNTSVLWSILQKSDCLVSGGKSVCVSLQIYLIKCSSRSTEASIHMW